jgi:hypothetical protein
MADHPDLAILPAAKRFNVREWEPPNILFNKSETGNIYTDTIGADTLFPVGLSAGEAGRLYWRPQLYVIESASLASTETEGTITWDGPISDVAHRPGTLPNATPLEASQPYHLLRGIGGAIKSRIDVATPEGIAEALFYIYPTLIRDGSLNYWNIYAELSYVPEVTNPLTTAATRIEPTGDPLYPTVQCGELTIAITGNDIIIPLYTILPPDGDPLYAGNVVAAMTIGYAGWPFSD